MKKKSFLIVYMLSIAILLTVSACSNGNTYSEKEYQDLLDENRALRNEVRELKDELDNLSALINSQGSTTSPDDLIGSWRAIYGEARDRDGNTQIINFNDFNDADVELNVVMLFLRDSIWEFHEDGSLRTQHTGEFKTYFEEEFKDAEPDQVDAFLLATNGVWVKNGDSPTGGTFYTLTMNNVNNRSEYNEGGIFESAVIITVIDGKMSIAYEEEGTTLHFEREPQ